MSLPPRPASGFPPPASLAALHAGRLQRVQSLQQQLDGVSLGEPAAGVQRPEPSDRWVTSGCPALDRWLPDGAGFRRGSLVEWLVAGPGSGAGTWALWVAWQACLRHGTLVVIDAASQFYPPAAAAWGLDLQRLVVIRPKSSRDTLWAWDQALRCPAVKAVWGPLQGIEDRWFRRFQLAAEQSGCLGLLLRPAKYRGLPSWSEVQLAVSARPATPSTATPPADEALLQREVTGQQETLRQQETLGRRRTAASRADPADASSGRWLRVELVRCRRTLCPGGSAADGHAVMDLKLESCHETPALHLVSELAHPASVRRESRA
jgi:hypothetical protein